MYNVQCVLTIYLLYIYNILQLTDGDVLGQEGNIIGRYTLQA